MRNDPNEQDPCTCRTCKIGRLFVLALRKREGLITPEEFDAESAPIVDELWPREVQP